MTGRRLQIACLNKRDDVLKEAAQSGEALARLARQSFSQIPLIYFTCPSGEGPIENIWKGGEAFQ